MPNVRYLVVMSTVGLLMAPVAGQAATKATTTKVTKKPVAAAAAPAPAAKPTLMGRLLGHTTTTKTTTAPAQHASVTTVSHPAAAGRMVTTKTSTGKTITYNCSKAGNQNKKACKA